jgi:hypothetical protein
VLESIGDDAQGERLHVRDGEIVRCAVGEYAWELDDLGEPAAIGLLLDFDAEMH